MNLLNWKTIGLVTTIVGGAVSVVSNIVEDRKMEALVQEKVDEAIAEKLNTNEEES